MNTELKYLPINWKNGMSFSADHLSEEYLAVADAIRDAIALSITPYNYGLLGVGDKDTFADSFQDDINNEQIEISFCRAVTQDGSRIEILNKKWEELSSPIIELIGSKDLSKSDYWYLLLIIAPFDRIPEGVENKNENFRRKPYTRAAYGFELVSFDDLERDILANAIPIAKFETTPNHDGLKKIKNYIPPCTKINSHEKLFKKYKDFENLLFELKDNAEKVIEKIKNKKKKSREINLLADDIKILCERYLTFFVENYDEYKFTFAELPPINLVIFFAKLARTLNHSMNMANDRSHMLQYFQEYATDVNTAQLNKIVQNTFKSKYTHFDTSNSLKIIYLFLETFNEIFEKLKDLDYRDLAPRNVVERDTYTDEPRRQRPSTSKGPIIVKHIGRKKGFGEDLED